METLVAQIAGNVAALGVFLAIIWWRLNRIEQRLDKKEIDADRTHDALWTQIRKVESSHAGLVATHNALQPDNRVE